MNKAIRLIKKYHGVLIIVGIFIYLKKNKCLCLMKEEAKEDIPLNGEV